MHAYYAEDSVPWIKCHVESMKHKQIICPSEDRHEVQHETVNLLNRKPNQIKFEIESTRSSFLCYYFGNLINSLLAGRLKFLMTAKLCRRWVTRVHTWPRELSDDLTWTPHWLDLLHLSGHTSNYIITNAHFTGEGLHRAHRLDGLCAPVFLRVS